MTTAYVDSSSAIAIEFVEASAEALRDRLHRFDRLVSSNLLEAELSSALAREERSDPVSDLLSSIVWLHPPRPLTAEFRRILAVGHLRGADLWHLACALWAAPDARELAFVTLDKRQRDVARKLGFPL